MESSVTSRMVALSLVIVTEIASIHSATHTDSELLFALILVLFVASCVIFVYFHVKMGMENDKDKEIEMVRVSEPSEKQEGDQEKRRECSPYVAGWPWAEECGMHSGSPCLCEICVAGHEILMTHASCTPEERAVLGSFLVGNGTNSVLASVAAANLVDPKTGKLCDCEACVSVRQRSDSMSGLNWVHPQGSGMSQTNDEGIVGTEFQGGVLLGVTGGPKEFKKMWVSPCAPGEASFGLISNGHVGHVYYFECDKLGFHDKYARYVGPDTDPQVQEFMKNVRSSESVKGSG